MLGFFSHVSTRHYCVIEIDLVELISISYQPGDEMTWIKDNMAYFQEQANAYDDPDFKEMLEEINEREDMKRFLQ